MLLLFDRRLFVLGLALMPLAGARGANAAEQRGLFWTAMPPGKPPSVLFGYARTAAAVTADIVKDGDRFVGQAQRLVADVANIQFPPISSGTLAPVVSRISPATADRLRAMLDKSLADKISGLAIALMLQGEGQAPQPPTVGGVIAEHAQAAGKPIVYLVSSDEVQAAYHPAADLAALDRRVDEDVLNYLLTLRERVGPIGKYQENLYAARRTAELAQVGAEMNQHGVPRLEDIFATLRSLEGTIIERSLQIVATAQDRAFLMLPVGTLTRDGGVLAKMRESGIQISLAA